MRRKFGGKQIKPGFTQFMRILTVVANGVRVTPGWYGRTECKYLQGLLFYKILQKSGIGYRPLNSVNKNHVQVHV